MDPRGIVVAQWARMKCMFGCKNYGKCGTCPPNVPPVAESQAFFKGYRRGAVFHFSKGVDRPEDRLRGRERSIRSSLSWSAKSFFQGITRPFSCSWTPVISVLPAPETESNAKTRNSLGPLPNRWLSMFSRPSERPGTRLMSSVNIPRI